jgi:hypothetical protein
VIAVKETPAGTTSVAAGRGDAQLTRLMSISEFGDSIRPRIVFKKPYMKTISWQNTNYMKGMTM